MLSKFAVGLTVAMFIGFAILPGHQAQAADSKTAKPAPKPNTLPGAPKPKNQDLTPAYNAYVNKLRTKINGVWNAANGKNHVVLHCTLSADGVVSDFQISSTPKNAAAEQAANEAFNQAQPLDSLPGNTPAAHLTLTFDSTSSQHESSTNLTTHLEPLARPVTPAQSESK